MNILLIHNHYQQPGGEDAVFSAEGALLREAGHHVITYTRSNDEVRALGAWGRLTLPARWVWAGDSVRALRQLIAREKPDVAHFHNTHFMISPAAYYACREAGVPVVQTLHNYRLLCPNALFLRGGAVCELCLGRTPPWPGVRYGCYRGSRLQTAGMAAMLTFHRWRRTWQEQVDCYIALTEFARQKFIQGGLPAEKIAVKPNFQPDPGEGLGREPFALFVGRLSVEKGLDVLAAAWEKLNVPLKIAGDGPLRATLAAQMTPPRQGTVTLLGQQPHAAVLNLLRQARFVVVPSTWYESFPMVVVEAFACGTPVIASRLGALAEIVADGRTGLHFTPGDAADLAAKVAWAWEHPEEMAAMGRNARAEYEAKYTPERNYEMLMAIYRTAIARAKACS